MRGMSRLLWHGWRDCFDIRSLGLYIKWCNMRVYVLCQDIQGSGTYSSSHDWPSTSTPIRWFMLHVWSLISPVKDVATCSETRSSLKFLVGALTCKYPKPFLMITMPEWCLLQVLKRYTKENTAFNHQYVKIWHGHSCPDPHRNMLVRICTPLWFLIHTGKRGPPLPLAQAPAPQRNSYECTSWW